MIGRHPSLLVLVAVGLSQVACSGEGQLGTCEGDGCSEQSPTSVVEADDAVGSGGSTSSDIDGGAEESTGGSGAEAGASGSESGSSVDESTPEAVCSPSVDLYDTSGAEIVGSGTPESCTEEALRAAAQSGGAVVFDCGEEPTTIALSQTIVLPADQDTIIDGGGLVTLDGQDLVRHFRFEASDWMTGTTKVVLQRLTLENGQAELGDYREPVDGYPECAYGYDNESGGGAIWIRDGILHVIDSTFRDNQAALEGPDVGGGAIYALGSAEVVITGSRFVGNTAANGGAVAMLFANLEIYNSVFESNTAVGMGQNRRVSEEECPAEYAFGHENQAGHGGLAGGVYFDGLNDEDRPVILCGSSFHDNRANELAGAFFRTPNSAEREVTIDRCEFDANTAQLGGATFIKDNAVTVRESTFANNRAGVLVNGDSVDGALGGLWVNSGSVDVVNSTFFDNQPSGLNVEGGSSTVQNSTFVQSSLNGDLSVSGSLFVDVDCGSSFSGDQNVQWPNGDPCASGMTFADPQLGQLGANGGPTPTAVPGQSEAVSGVVSTGCPTTDQRGEERPADACAAGAVEP